MLVTITCAILHESNTANRYYKSTNFTLTRCAKLPKLIGRQDEKVKEMQGLRFPVW